MPEESDRRTQILDAALEEFSAKGFRGATIKSISQAARLQSQALIYWYFPNKEALFQAVLGQYAPILQAIQDPDALMDRPPDEVLPQLATAYLSFADQPLGMRLAKLVIGESLRRPEMAEVFARRGPAVVLSFLKRYLGHQVDLGRLRTHDVRASARAYIGMLMPQMMAAMFLPALKSDGLSDEEHIRTVTDIFLRGLAPESQEAP